MSRALSPAELWARLRFIVPDVDPSGAGYQTRRDRVKPRPPIGARLPSHDLHVALEAAAAGGMAQLAERLRLDLADALAGHVERGAHLFQGPRAAVLGQPEAEADHLGLALGERFQDPVDPALQYLGGRR